MPDWTAPFHLPKFTDDEFEVQKAKYVAEHGYTITVPGLSDIIKLDFEKPMTEEEEYWYKKKLWHLFDPKRLAHLREVKAKRKERYQNMLASPAPEIVRHAGSILTAADDAQDAISTLAVAGKIGMKIAPKVLGKVLSGPVGLLTAASDALNAVQAIGTFCLAPMMGKRQHESLSKASPKHRKAKIKRAARIKNWKPNVGDALQALQTTEQIWGVGISLGPLMGLAQDIVAGAVRMATGQKVKLKAPPILQGRPIGKAQMVLKDLAALWGFIHGTNETELALQLATANLAYQHVMEANKVWHPLESVDSTDELEILAPIPTNPITLEIIEEGPEPLERVIGWPQTGTLWANMRELQEITAPMATENLKAFMSRNKHSWTGYIGGVSAVNGADFSLGSIEAEEDVFYDYSVQTKVATLLLSNSITLDPDQPDDRFELFNAWLEQLDANNDCPTLSDVVSFCGASQNNIKLLHTRQQPIP